MGAIAFFGGALEPIANGMASVSNLTRRVVNRVRIALLHFELDTSRKYVDVLNSCMNDDLVARRAFPLYQVQIDRRIKTNAALIVRECEIQSSIQIKLMHLK